MADLCIDFEWLSCPDKDPLEEATTARLEIYIDDFCLTRNVNTFTKTIENSVNVSLYPLAMWLVSSWWRLHYEILPADLRMGPGHNWRLSHEMSAANSGFVWPNLVMAPDWEEIQIWAQPTQEQDHSVFYLNGLNDSRIVPKKDFTLAVSSFVDEVVTRLNDSGLQDTDLSQIWSLIKEEQRDSTTNLYRLLEAQLGYDPGECPDKLIGQAVTLEKKLGSSFSELSGAYAKGDEDRIQQIYALTELEGITGKPDMPQFVFQKSEGKPWQLAVHTANELRCKMGMPDGNLSNENLFHLLGLTKEKYESWMPIEKARAAVAERGGNGSLKLIPRKSHPVSRRFELARFIGDYLRLLEYDSDEWLVSADLSTSRQKFQRAFAAELLCPIKSLVEFMDDDFSESAIESAVSLFDVSEKTIESQLVNNGYMLPAANGSEIPYKLAF